VAFLNDALANPDNERGQYMFFDTDGDGLGDVYINTSMQGGSGSEPGARTVKMFSPSVAGRIVYNTGSGQYETITTPTDYSDHPVAGVSWYGAVKYCNWLTIDQGFPLEERCYTENTHANLTAWRPITITTADWETRDLNDGERLALVTEYLGYRLPMDQGYNNASPGADSADAYNEWYMAAAWNGSSNTLFGFGRSTITGADANYVDSGDPFDNGTTPVGYYDGTDQGGFQTNANENALGLFDMSGNAYQWIQGRFNTHAQSINYRVMRGGSWNNAATGSQGLETTTRVFTITSLTNGQIGFRVVRSAP
ncbi:MAG: SUMF1/EgtB/PvdO family nonheme iron enzyme, partial [Phycisphaerales bacterium]